MVAPSMPDEELYDTEADPHETVNLVDSNDEMHKTALSRLRSTLDRWLEESNDHGDIHR
jgi:hypothetical protein